MALLEVRLRLLSGREWRCEVPASGSIYDVQTLVKSQLGVSRRLQHLILEGSEVHARDLLTHFEQADLLDVTLVIAARLSLIQI